jgi:FtsZ-interacting cell division protein ZipA
MDGSKTINAEYELDLTYISVIVAAIAAIPIAMDVLFKKRKKLKSFFHIPVKKTNASNRYPGAGIY